MADFRTHITVSTALGVAYGVGAHTYYGVPWESATLAGALCSVSGMLPDVDSDSGTPLRESLAFAAAAVSMMLIERCRSLDVTHETLVLIGVLGYLTIRFGLGALLKHCTVHRGMFHSLPALLVATEVAFLLATGSLQIRLFKAAAVAIGCASHLVLDELWSVDLFRVRIKRSFGTAIKFWSESRVANAIAYLLLAVATLATFHDAAWLDSPPQTRELHQLATSLWNSVTR